MDGNDNYGAAFVWIRNGKIVQANFTFQTPSYDWANLANYCFRHNGSIASVTTTLNDLNLDVSVHRVALYSDNGERSQITEEARVLSTKKRTNVPDEIVQAEKGDSSNSGFNTPMYRSIDDLPFAKLLAR